MSYRFIYTTQIVRAPQEIERAHAEVTLTILPPAVAEGLRMRARVKSTHFSTRIEGNRLTLSEAQEVVIQGRRFAGHERDTLEVLHYFQALAQVEAWAERGDPISEERIQKLHALLYRGKRSRPTPWRDGQNVIRDGNGAIVYLPPEAKDVPVLMQELIDWIGRCSHPSDCWDSALPICHYPSIF